MALTTIGSMMMAILAQAATGEPLVATPDNAGPMRIHVGDTGIRCVKFPCPSRAVFLPVGERGVTQKELLYTDRDGKTPPPPMIGDEAALAAITEAWNERACLAIDGRLISGEDDRPVLRVDRIVGPCRDEKA